MENNNGNEGQQVEWNLASALITEIAERLHQGGDHYVNRNYVKAFELLHALRRRIVQSLEDNESAKFKEIEGIFYKLCMFAFATRVHDDKRKKLKRRAQARCIFLLEKYNDALMKSLDTYGYLISKKKDSKRLL